MSTENKLEYIDIITADESEETLQFETFPCDPGEQFEIDYDL